MKILRISASNAKYGGNVYERLIDDALAEYECEAYHAAPKIKGNFRYFFFPIFYIKVFLKNLFTDCDVIIQPLESLFWLNSNKKNVVLIHHFDPSYSNFLSKINQKFTFLMLKLNLKKISVVVVVSNYWKKYFEDLGFENVVVIYNCFDVNLFKKISFLSNDFKLPSDKINIYIGNAHPKKGFYEVVSALDGLPVNLISSGYADKNAVGVDVTNFVLEYSSYLNMLRKVDLVITFSQFKEGWCRTAHEALLLGTPVIGSGAGGMQELLIGSNQLIANDKNELRRLVEKFILDKSIFCNIECSFVFGFTEERFKKEWNNIIF